MTSTAPPYTTPVTVAPGYAALCELVAARVEALVRDKPDAVLGLATGSTPLGVYDILARRHAQAGLDFSGVTCFNLDEYYPMADDDPRSYHRFMRENLFQWIDCKHWSVPDGRERGDDEIARDCAAYEAAIREAGGIDMQLLGVGRSGHVGFNEPGSAPDSRTRLVTLHRLTREDAAASFGGLAHVPTRAVTMGVGTILEAREVLVMASGSGKAAVVRSAWEGPVTAQVLASWVRTHPNARLCLDRDAAALLSE